MKQTAKAIGILVVSVIVVALAFWHGDFFKPKIKLADVVTKTMKGTTGTYAIAIKNFKTEESFYKNEHQQFDSGSLYKLWVMGAAYEQIKEGKIQKNQVLSRDIAVLNKKFNLDVDSAEFTTGTITLTVSQAIHQMITISHNYAALLLSEKLTLSYLTQFLKSNHFTESSVGGVNTLPKTTAADIANFFEKLYLNEFTSKKFSKEMIDILKKQQLNNGIPKYLLKVSVAHKTGDIGWFKHDAGIVYDKNGDYIIVVLSETNSPTGAQERIAKLSKAVYTYFHSESKP